jgi:hypothetical protein
MEASAQLDAPAALPPRKEYPVPLGPTAGLDAVAKRKKSHTVKPVNVKYGYN